MSGIVNSEALTDIFGYWPSFHDAEVFSLRFEREGHSGYHGPTLETQIHVFEMTNEVSEQGFFVLRKNTLITLRFFQIDEFQANGFNQQNALWGVEITDVSDHQMEDIKFKVKFSKSIGLKMCFVCKSVEVVKVEPYSPLEGLANGSVPDS